MILIMASLTRASAVMARCSTSRARRRLRLIRDRVSSPTGAFGLLLNTGGGSYSVTAAANHTPPGRDVEMLAVLSVGKR
jgi:hypothetical protein